MKRLTHVTCVALATALLTLALPTTARAAAPPDLLLPVTGSAPGFTFVGTFDLKRFVATDSGIAAVGTVAGTLVDTAGNVTTFVRNVSIPISIIETSCDILHLELGPLDLDLLGLVVHLNKIVLDIDAQAGAGNLLGNLLCAVVGLLDNPTGLAKLLNNILSIIG